MSIKPGATILPRTSTVSVASPAMLASTAAILPPAIATSRMASRPNRRVDDAPALGKEIGGGGERAGDAGRHCSARALASVHHGRFPYRRFGHTACLQRVDRTVP